MATTRAARRNSRSMAVIVTGLLSTLALGASMNGTISSLTATITNSHNQAGLDAGLKITETAGAVTCNSWDASATCATIDKYGSQVTLTGGGAAGTPTVVQIQKLDGVPVQAFSIDFGACGGNSTATDLCHPTDTTKAMSVKLRMSTTSNTAGWVDLGTKTVAAWDAAGYSLPAGSDPNNVKATLNDSAKGKVWFEFTPVPCTAAGCSSGKYIDQPIVWNATT